MTTASTRVAGVIGMPIRHSLSPAIFEAAFEACGLDWAYLAFEVGDADSLHAMEAIRALGLEGVSVTMPHKLKVIPGLDGLEGAAAALGAVNCVVRRGSTLWGHNTDGAGFVDSLRVDSGLDVAGMRCVVVGAGGAGRAVAHALGASGARHVVIVNRTPEHAQSAAALAGAVGRVGGQHDVAEADLVVNATPVGMAAADPLAVDPLLLAPGQTVVDLVYHPVHTPLLAAAAAAGARTVDGVGMLVHQAGHAFKLWTGQEPPLPAMRNGALAALDETEVRS